MDGMMRDAEKLGVRNWRIKARDRDGWRRLLESAKTLLLLFCRARWLIPPDVPQPVRLIVLSLF
jgi:hypothetical protein